MTITLFYIYIYISHFATDMRLLTVRKTPLVNRSLSRNDGVTLVFVELGLDVDDKKGNLSKLRITKQALDFLGFS
jgi:hypothetical protein